MTRRHYRPHLKETQSWAVDVLICAAFFIGCLAGATIALVLL